MPPRKNGWRACGVMCGPGSMPHVAGEYADSAARSDIESFHPRDDDGWYDTSTGLYKDDEYKQRWLVPSLRYLDLRGLIERKPDAPHLVRFLKAPV